MAYPQFALLFNAKDDFDNKVKEFMPFFESFEKSLLPPGLGANLTLRKKYRPFKVSQEQFGLILARAPTPYSYLEWDEEKRKNYNNAIEKFENKLAKEMIGSLNPQYFVAGDSESENIFEYSIEFNEHNWRLALSPHPQDERIIWDALSFLDKDLGLRAETDEEYLTMLFDHTRPEVANDLRVLQEHLSETELRKLIKKFSLRYFEDSKENIGIVRCPALGASTNTTQLGKLMPNFFIRRKLRREGVKLYFGLMESACLLSAKISHEPFGEVLSDESYGKIHGYYAAVVRNSEQLNWARVSGLLTEQERIDFGLD